MKTAKLEIQVKNIADARAVFQQQLRENNGDLVSENFSQNEGVHKEYFTAKVPLQYFDGLVSGISRNVGTQTRTFLAMVYK